MVYAKVYDNIDFWGGNMIGKQKINRLPPYTSYATWQRLLEAFQHFLPDVVDSSYYQDLKLSGSSVKSLRLALRYLGLIDDNNVAQDRLKRLTRAREGEGGESKSAILREILRDAYTALFSPEDKLASATLGQLSSYFESIGAKGQMLQKCMTFFLSLAAEAELNLSPHLAGRSRLGIGRKSIVLKSRERSRERKESLLQEGKISESHIANSFNLSKLHPAIAGLLRELPAPSSAWNKQGKERFKSAFDATLDLIYPTEE